MKFITIELLFGAARSAVAAIAFVSTAVFAPAVLAQEEAQEAPVAEEAVAPAEEPAPAEAVETIPVEATEAAPVAEPAPAAEGSTQLDAIEVTGSRIKRSDYETAQPILIIKREDIDRAGMVSIGDILQNLPQAGAALSRAFNNGGNGATEIDLRNLGSNRVLVLVNGRRWVGGVSQFNTSGVDLNTIPISVIDSIEVLKDGASAVYGSDAIAGVINIKTRRDYVGAEVSGHLEATDRGDGVSQLVSFAGGTVAGKTSVFFDVSYVNQGELLSGSRKPSSIPNARVPNGSRGSGFSPFSRSLFVPSPQNGDAINAAAGEPAAVPTAPCYDFTGNVGGGALTGSLADEGIESPIEDIPNVPAGAVQLCDLTLDRDAFAANGARDFIRYDVNEHGYNYAPINYLITPQERTSIFGQLSHQITDQMRFSTEVLYNVRKSAQQLAHSPIGCGDVFAGVKPFDICFVASDNPFNPTNPTSPYYIPGTEAQDIGRGDAGSGLVGYGAILRRFTELGPRIFSQNVDTMRIGGGLDGSFGGSGLDSGNDTIDSIFSPLLDRFYSWDSGYAFTENRLQQIDNGLVDGARVARAAGPIADCAGVQDPTDPNAPFTAPPAAAFGCVPIDFFGGPGALTPEMAKYVRYTGVDATRQTQRLAYGNLSTEISELSRWLAGPLGIAVGVEYREEFFNGSPDPLKANRTSSTNAVNPTRGAYQAKEAYMELRIPVLADVTFDEVPGLNNISWLKGRSFVQDLELSLAGRQSNYSGFGNNFSGKLGIRYKPYEDLILRATVSDAFRAPAITDLFLGQATSFPRVNDPCADRDNALRDDEPGIENVRTNCDADGAAASQTTSQIATVFGGNPNLEPETARTISAGFVYSPEFLPDFNIYADWYSIELEQFIGALPPGIILELCYRSNPGNRAYCDLVSRGATGQLAGINAVFQNFAALNVSGVDFNVDWILPLPEQFRDFGTFQWVLDAAYVSKYEQVIPTAAGEEKFNLPGLFSLLRMKINTGLQWRRDNWEASWNVRYLHRQVEICDDGFQQVGAGNGTSGDDVGGNPTPVLSLEQLGACSDPDATTRFGGSAVNEMKAIFYNDLQASYALPNWNTKLTFGVLNALDQDPPYGATQFADSYDKSLYDPYGSRTPYARFKVNF